MKIIAYSDLHGNIPGPVPECDLVVIAGDICPHFSHFPGSDEDREGQAEWLKGPFKAWLETIPSNVPIVGTWGNHDFVGYDFPPFELPLTILKDDGVSVVAAKKTWQVYGTPYTPTFMTWAFMESEPGLSARFDNIPNGLDILISHGPPKYACDQVGAGTERLGSQALFRKLCTMLEPPKVVICGHIHGGKGNGILFNPGKSIEVYNVASIDEAYRPHKQMWTEIEVPNI